MSNKRWRSLAVVALSVAGVAAAQGTPGPPPDAAMPQLRMPVLLMGRPFPQVKPYRLDAPFPVRTFHVKRGKVDGDGSEEHPWNDLGSALCQLQAGDELRIEPGKYNGSLVIDENVSEGASDLPIRIVFSGRSVLSADAGRPALEVRRSHWQIINLFVKGGQSASPSVVIGGGASFVSLDRLRVAGGAGPGITIMEGAHDVTISNSVLAKDGLRQPGMNSVGVDIAPGTRSISLINNHLHENPAGSIRVRRAAPGTTPANHLKFIGNTIRNDGSSAITVHEANGVRIENNTLTETPGLDTRGIVLEKVTDAVVRTNQISDYGLGISIGRVETRGGSTSIPADITVDHNHFDTTATAGIVASVEAGKSVRLVNNVADGYSDGLLILGNRGLVEALTVANNLLCGLTGTAFVLRDPASATLFDYNVFSPAAGPINAGSGSKTLALVDFLEKGSMPHTKASPGVRIVDHDLGRVVGVKTVDRGSSVEGLAFEGAAPDLGLAER